MTIFGLNSPELFVLLVITLVILGIKRIEKGLDLLSRLLKFLLSNQSSIDKKAKKKEPIKEIEEIFQKTEEAYNKIKDFTSKETELESFIEKTTEEIEQDVENPEGTEDVEEQKGKFTKTKIVQLDSES